jgi:predicted transcriptional regulator
MGKSTTLTVRLDPKLKKKLDKLAESTKRSKSFLASEAIASFVELNEWQIKEIKEGIKEADAGDFASDEEVRKTFGKWTGNAR